MTAHAILQLQSFVSYDTHFVILRFNYERMLKAPKVFHRSTQRDARVVLPVINVSFDVEPQALFGLAALRISSKRGF